MPSILQNPNAGAPTATDLPGQAPQQAQAQAQPQPQPQQTGGSGPEALSLEQQDQYDKVVMAGMEVLFKNEKVSKSIVSRLKTDSKNPAKALSDTVSMLMIQLDHQVGDQIDEAIILPAAAELLEQTAELADSLQLFPIDDAVLQHAAQLMVQNLAEQYGTSPEDIRGLIEATNPEELKRIEEEQGNFARKQPPQDTV